MKRFYIHRPSRGASPFGYSTGHKNKYSANKTTLYFPWAKKSFTFYPEKPNKTDKDGNLENYWDQGCKVAGTMYFDPAQLNNLMAKIKVHEDLKKKIKRLECEYNAWLTGRYRLDSEVKSNCDSLTFELDNPAPTRLRCVHRTKENLAKGQSYWKNWENYYANELTLDALKSRVTELEQDIAYEKEQAKNLKTERERRGISQREMNILYPEAQAVMEELAPQASPAEEAAYEMGEFEDVDGDGRNDNTGVTGQEKRYWLYAGIGVVLLGLAGFIATKKIK